MQTLSALEYSFTQSSLLKLEWTVLAHLKGGNISLRAYITAFQMCWCLLLNRRRFEEITFVVNCNQLISSFYAIIKVIYTLGKSRFDTFTEIQRL